MKENLIPSLLFDKTGPMSKRGVAVGSWKGSLAARIGY
jgi:hypothetical protein